MLSIHFLRRDRYLETCFHNLSEGEKQGLPLSRARVNHTQISVFPTTLSAQRSGLCRDVYLVHWIQRTVGITVIEVEALVPTEARGPCKLAVHISAHDRAGADGRGWRKIMDTCSAYPQSEKQVMLVKSFLRRHDLHMVD